MNTRTVAYALLSAMAVASPLSPVLAQSGIVDEDVPITITTDKEAYGHDETITVRGAVASPSTGTPVTLIVTSPTDNRVYLQQLTLGADGTFEDVISTGGPLWQYDGEYKIRVQYGGQAVNNVATVSLVGGIPAGPVAVPPAPVECGASELSLDAFCVPYEITGGEVSGASIDEDQTSVIVEISGAEGGTLVLTGTDPVIRGVLEGTILVGGEQWDDASVDGGTFTVEFPAGTERIEFIGTWVIPEFGAVAAAVMAAALVAAIAATSRLGLARRI